MIFSFLTLVRKPPCGYLQTVLSSLFLNIQSAYEFHILHTKGRLLNQIYSFSRHILRTIARHWEISG